MQIRTIQDLRALVRSRRDALDLTQVALAERAGVSRRWISMFENGHEAAEVGRLLAVLDALDVRLAASIVGAPHTPAGPDEVPGHGEQDAVDLREVLREYTSGDA